MLQLKLIDNTKTKKVLPFSEIVLFRIERLLIIIENRAEQQGFDSTKFIYEILFVFAIESRDYLWYSMVKRSDAVCYINTKSEI